MPPFAPLVGPLRMSNDAHNILCNSILYETIAKALCYDSLRMSSLSFIDQFVRCFVPAPFIQLSRHSADLCFRGTRPGRHGRSEKGNLLHWKTVCSEVAVGNCKPILQLIPYATQTRCTAFIEQRSTSYMSNTARIKKSDLAYYIHDGPAAFRFQLSGDVSGAGVRNLEQTWRTA